MTPPEVLTKKIGPLPGGAWLALVGGAVGISFLARKKRVTTARPSVVATPATTAQDQSSQGAIAWQPATAVSSAGGFPTFASNEEWARQAVATLIGSGAEANRATNAISHVLYPDAASPTTPGDSALYNLVAARIGPPPALPSQAFIPDPPTVGPVPTIGPPAPGLGVTGSQYLHDAAGRIIGLAQSFAPNSGHVSAYHADFDPASNVLTGGYIINDTGGRHDLTPAELAIYQAG